MTNGLRVVLCLMAHSDLYHITKLDVRNTKNVLMVVI
jgi:hypothetical protein